MVSYNRGTQKFGMVCDWKYQSKMDDLGVPPIWGNYQIANKNGIVVGIFG